VPAAKLVAATITLNTIVLTLVPPPVVTRIGPLATPVAGTVTLMVVAVRAVKVSETPFRATAVAPARFVPVRVVVAVLPARTELTLYAVTVGTTKVAVALKLAVFAVVTEIVSVITPAVAPLGTTVKIVVSLTTLKGALTVVPVNLTLVTPVKPVPVRVTAVPTPPEVGAVVVTFGAMPTR
jgi:hypothetical protein